MRSSSSRTAPLSLSATPTDAAPQPATAFNVVVFGGCVADALHRANNASLRATSMHGTSNVCSLDVSFGGVGRNVAEACSRLGLRVKLVSVVGDDALGNALVQHTRQLKGVDVEDLAVLPGQTTASYTAILDGAGELCVASAVMQILDDHLSAERQILRVPRVMAALQDGGASWLVVDGNVPKKELEAVVQLVGSINQSRKAASVPLLRVAYDPISATKVLRSLDCLSGIDVMKPNLGEAVVLGRRCGLIDASTENMAIRVAQSIDAPQPAKGCAPSSGGLADEWKSFIATLNHSTSDSNDASTHDDGNEAAANAGKLDVTSTCRLLYALLRHVVLGLVRRYPSLTVLCTLGPLGCAVGVGSASVMRIKAVGHARSPLLRCFPPPDVPKASIRKVTGAGDSFLSGFIFASMEVLGLGLRVNDNAVQQAPRHDSVEEEDADLNKCVRIASAVAATALTSRHTISHHLSREAIMGAVAAAGNQKPLGMVKARL